MSECVCDECKFKNVPITTFMRTIEEVLNEMIGANYAITNAQICEIMEIHSAEKAAVNIRIRAAACKRHDFDPCFKDHSREYMEKRANFCPLVGIPEPHGALIDRDALNIGEYEREDDDTGTLEISLGGLLDLYHKIKGAPTVIEGSENHEQDT